MSYNNPYTSYGASSYGAGASGYGSQQASSSAGYANYAASASMMMPSDAQRMDMLAAETQRAAFQAEMAQQSSIYTPEAAKKGGYQVGGKGKARQTVLRKGGGELWEDPTLTEWDPSWFRLFIGDLDPALSDDLFNKAFNNERYPSFMKGKIVRDKYTNKGKGFGFVAYKDSEDFLKCWKEMNGKYVGSRPVSISRAETGVRQVQIGSKKAKQLDAKHKKKTGTEAFSRSKEIDHAQRTGSGAYGPIKDRKSYIRR